MGDTNRTLYLHCGYHKTGSSFLQTMFARNRELLIKGGIHYPLSDNELEMISGNLSLGNGYELSCSIDSSDNGKIRDILEAGINEALKNDCDSVLYSSEAFFHTFAKENALETLLSSAKHVGFQDIKALVYFRDPVSHALSLYKHRAKRGAHANFKTWIANDYETMSLLSSFNCYDLKECSFEWSCRKYKKDSDFMLESSFKDWLGIDVPKIPNDEKVNRSLAWSEIILIQTLKENYPGIDSFLWEELSKICAFDKSRDDALDRFFHSVATKELKKYGELVKSINQLLPKGEELKLENKYGNSFINAEDLEINLKSKQVMALATALTRSINSRKLSNKTGRIWEKGVNKVKRYLAAAGF